MTSLDPSSCDRATLGRRFLDRYGLAELDPADLDLALTHRSYAVEHGLAHDNERLEFLGDAVIGLLATEYVFEHEQHADEGAMSKLRARLVSRQLLGRQALELGFGDLVLLGRGERDSGGDRRASILGSALEALVGIVYWRLGYSSASAFVRHHVIRQSYPAALGDHRFADFKTELQEWAQQHYHQVPTYRRVGEHGPDHDKRFEVEVEVAGQALARATDTRIKTAENEAARRALERIRSGDTEPLT